MSLATEQTTRPAKPLARPGDLIDADLCSEASNRLGYVESVDQYGYYVLRVDGFATGFEPPYLTTEIDFWAHEDIRWLRVEAEGVQTITREERRRDEIDRANFDARVRIEVEKITIRKEAERLARGGSTALAVPDGESLSVFLTENFGEDTFAVDALLPVGGNALCAAAAKAGKTTLNGNLIRALVDGDSFLAEFEIPRPKTVALLDFEMSPKQLQTWLRDQGIQHSDRVRLFTLRGNASSFNILDPETRSRWATRLQGIDVLIIDPLRPILDALGLNEWNETGPFLQAFNELKAEAGISEGIIFHHYGHHAERAAGDSRLLGWPDTLWDLTRDNADDPRSVRMFSARGRDVDVEARPLRLDGRRLTLGGNALEARMDLKLETLLRFIADQGEVTRTQIETARLSGISKNNLATVLAPAIMDGRIRERAGDKGKKYYSIGAVDEFPF